MNFLEYKNFAIEFSKKAGSELLKYYGNLSSFESKSTNVDLVTIADKLSENIIIKEIKSHFPDHDIITEETHMLLKNADYRWVIDPLDGTTNFVHSLPIFAVSIGLQYKEETIVAVVYNPVYDKCFWSIKDSGAYLNKNPISVSTVNKLSESLLVTGFPYKHDQIWHDSFELFHELYSRSQGIRRLGSASLDFCYVAMGRFDCFYEFGLKPWDVCAGDLICREAGGNTSDWSGNSMPFSGDRIIASNGNIHQYILDVFLESKFSHMIAN